MDGFLENSATVGIGVMAHSSAYAYEPFDTYRRFILIFLIRIRMDLTLDSGTRNQQHQNSQYLLSQQHSKSIKIGAYTALPWVAWLLSSTII